MSLPRYYVTHKTVGGSLVLKKEWGGVKRGAVWKSEWLMDVAGATTFLSIEDAWAGFDRAGFGARDEYEVLPMEGHE